MYDINRIHRFKRDYVQLLSESIMLNDLCEEMWVFGSTVEGCSTHVHTPFSDIDLAVLPVKNHDNIQIIQEILKILNYDKNEKRKPGHDIIWLEEGWKTVEDDLYNNIKKGECVICH